MAIFGSFNFKFLFKKIQLNSENLSFLEDFLTRKKQEGFLKQYNAYKWNFDKSMLTCLCFGFCLSLSLRRYVPVVNSNYLSSFFANAVLPGSILIYNYHFYALDKFYFECRPIFKDLLLAGDQEMINHFLSKYKENKEFFNFRQRNAFIQVLTLKELKELNHSYKLGIEGADTDETDFDSLVQVEIMKEAFKNSQRKNN